MKKIYALVLTVALSFAAVSLYSITHVVTQQGNSFSPNTLEVEVGDVVRWVWTGGSHTTTSVSVPSGASPWNSPLNSSNTQFEYTVAVAGNYGYVCTPHAQMGMVGGFVAVDGEPSCSVNPVITQDENTVTVSINGTGAANPLYSISWGDNSFPSNMPTDSHTYLEPGTYEICVTYLDQDNMDGCLVNNCDLSVVIENTGTPECTVELTTVVDGSSVMASALGTGVENGQYSIDWGDGTSTESSSGTHDYEENGEYTICVMYGSFLPGGCVSEDCDTVTIETEEPMECSLTILATSLGGLNMSILSNGTGAEAPDYSVDWGDGNVEEAETLSTHEYAEDGEYIICVTYTDIENPENCIVEQCTTVVVSSSVGQCSVTLTITNVGNVYTATAVGTGATSAQYAINWGDQTAPTIASTGTHTYASPGEYEICVVYTDFLNMANCTVTDCETVNIIVSVNEVEETINQLEVMPNPVSESTQLVFSLSKSSYVQIEVMDVFGRHLDNIFNGSLGQGNQRVFFDSQNLVSGIYFVRLVAGNEQKSICIVK